MKKIPLIAYSTLSAILMSLAWPHVGSLFPLVFVGLVPMLLLEDQVLTKRLRPRKVLFHSYWFFLLFNLFTTWWIWNASPGGMIMAVTVNALLMTLPFWLFHVTRRRVGNREGYFAFFVFWLCFEYLHYLWELSWPWLSYGNVFANQVELVQWYEFTGVTGGSLWVLTMNLLSFQLWKLRKFLLRKASEENNVLQWTAMRKTQWKRVLVFGLTFLLPASVSLMMYFAYEEKKDPVDVVIVQPNIDPYYEKFDGMGVVDQLDKYIQIARTKLDANVDFVLGPETQLPVAVNEKKIETNSAILQLKALVSEFPKLRLITGMSSYRVYEPGETPSETAGPIPGQANYFYDNFNAALQIENGEPVQTYHKMKLVLGVEKIPFTGIFPFLEDLALDLGGTSGSLGIEAQPKLFHSSKGKKIRVAPAICYESIYGDHIAGFVRQGADVLFIITNDGWWDNTPGYRQHMAYARLRAIENRRSIARCANTGVSCFINQRGDVLLQSAWWEPVAIRTQINANTELTWFSKYGDLIGKYASFAALVLLLYTLYAWIMGKTSLKREI